MKLRTQMLIGTLALLSFGASRPFDDVQPTARDLALRASVIKPSPGELKWQQIPWMTDFAAAQASARAERRPLFLWVTGDDPLERC